ncbi:hypothetical protein GCM10012320_30210 [Sinomonas cellulolyticus]|uniref:PqqD family protein n=1 Tax=Sinomonas cellulolyticus TaxID=2801916 RepID=A0ABS1JY55_9MICC|nr:MULTISPECIES: PqqD family protein [Sinomonas]MBL0704128.1 PqqD family protein [Sinomonas cellulolyticus]GHG57226.1 hypothetical protein GCM10012320_30210 [Sinomonas sp. KCTC 49339]
MARIWRRGRRVAEVVADDGSRAAILHLDADRPLVLTDSAARIWCLVDGVRTQDVIRAELAAEYGADPGTPLSDEIGREVDRFLADLASRGLIEEAPERMAATAAPAPGEVLRRKVPRRDAPGAVAGSDA